MVGVVAGKGAKYKSKWVREAIDELEHYKTIPFTTDFMKKYNLPILPTRRAMHDLIQRKITRSKISEV